MLRDEQIAILRKLQKPRASNKPRTGQPKPDSYIGKAYVRSEGGLKEVSLNSVEIGSFVGKAGSLRRSRKGRTYRLANGRRTYQAPWKDPVVSYKPLPIVR